MIKRIKEFLNGVVFEMKKVSWPSLVELRGSTFVVIVLSILLAVFLFVVDVILSKLLNIIL